MCPNQEVTLLPDCHIANRLLMYSMLQSLQAEDLGTEEVDIQLRDRFEVFSQVMLNFPMPLHAGPDYEYVNNALLQQRYHNLYGAHSSTSLENNMSGSSDSEWSNMSSVSCSSL